MQTINEGALHLHSARGAAKMGSIKASDISVATSGVHQCVPLLCTAPALPANPLCSTSSTAVSTEVVGTQIICCGVL